MEKKITKKEMFTTMLEKYDFSPEEVKFINHEIDLLNRKKGTSGKLTAAQELAEKIKVQILEVLTDGKKRTATEFVKELQPAYEDITLTNQRISAILKKMVDEDGTVARVKEGRKTLFYAVAE